MAFQAGGKHSQSAAEHQKHGCISLQSMFMILKRDKATLRLYKKCLPGDAKIGHRHTKLQITSSISGEQTLEATNINLLSFPSTELLHLKNKE